MADAGCSTQFNWTVELENAVIDFFAENPCLWNHRRKDYYTREKRAQLLNYLCAQLGTRHQGSKLTVGALKARWKNMRTTFQREHKKVAMSRAFGMGPDNIYNSKWRHYPRLLFLSECEDEQLNKGHFILKEEFPETHSLDEITANDSIISVSPIPSEETLTLEDMPGTCLSDIELQEPRPKHSRTSRDKGTGETSMEALQSPAQCLRLFDKPNDHNGFFSYVTEFLSAFPRDKQREAKMEMIETMHRLGKGNL
uniref:uncharacterized protein n=1 Tax=Myxine glutinosa TaxID=7769 RepID=UPI00358E8B50